MASSKLKFPSESFTMGSFCSILNLTSNKYGRSLKTNVLLHSALTQQRAVIRQWPTDMNILLMSKANGNTYLGFLSSTSKLETTAAEKKHAPIV